MAQGRVQVGDLQQNKLQPAGIQSDTYAAPARTPQDQNTLRLADALSSFSSTLGNLAPTLAAANKDRAEKEQWAIEKRIAGRTREEWVAEVEAGNIMPHENELQKKAVLAAQGMNYGTHRVDQLKHVMMTEFDWDNQDPDQYITDAINADLEKYGSDRNFGAPYIREMEKLRGWSVGYRENRKSEQFVQEKANAAFGIIDTKLDEMIAGQTDPLVAAKNVRAMYQQLGKDGTLGVDYASLDQEVLNKARRIASTHPEYALALMETEHVGKDGVKIRLADKPAMRDAYLNIQSQAAKAIDTRTEAQSRQRFSEDDLTLMRQGGLDSVDDVDVELPSGKTITVTRKERIDAAQKVYKDISDREAVAGRETPILRLSRELNDYRKNGLEHPQLKREVTGIADMANPAAIADEDQRTALLQKVHTAQWLASESKNTYLSYTNPKDSQFVETFLLAKSSMVHKDGRTYSDDEALSFAMETTNPVTPEGQLKAEQAKRTIETTMRTMGSKPGLIWGTNNITPENYSTVYQRGVVLSQRFVMAGMEPELAVERAFKMIKDTSVTFRGNVLMDLAGMSIPDDFEEAMGAIVDDFAFINPLTLERNGIDAEDISIEPINNPNQKSGGRFRLIDRGDRTPILDDKGNMVTITLDAVRLKSQTLKDTREFKVRQEAVDKQDAQIKAREQAKLDTKASRDKFIKQGVLDPDKLKKGDAIREQRKLEAAEAQERIKTGQQDALDRRKADYERRKARQKTRETERSLNK